MTPRTATINGKLQDLAGVPDDERLLDLLRWRLGLRGTKEGCRTGDCGACTVLLEGRSVLSCLTLAREAEGRKVETVESLAQERAGQLVSEAFALSGGVQCGYCTPGFVVAVAGLLREHPLPTWTPRSLQRDLGGNLCRCTGYYGIVRALASLLRDATGEAGADGAPSSRFQVLDPQGTTPHAPHRRPARGGPGRREAP